ncbi:MAG: hypothetical protein ABIL37_01330 [candidate division WOR-3 bacterium]
MEEWKAITIQKILFLQEKYSENKEVISILEKIKQKLDYLNLTNLPDALLTIHFSSKTIPELSSLLPNIEDIIDWYRR